MSVRKLIILLLILVVLAVILQPILPGVIDSSTELIVIAVFGSFLVIAGYGAYKGGGGLIFTRLAGTLLFLAVLSMIIFGPEETIKLVEDLRRKANELVTDSLKYNGSPPSEAEQMPIPDPEPNGGTLYHPFKFLLSEDWQEVSAPKKTCIEANPRDKVESVAIRPDLAKVRSATGKEEIVFLTWKRSGQCS